MSKITPCGIEPGEKEQVIGVFFFHLRFLPVPPLTAQRNIPSLCAEGILHPRTSVSILWLMQQGAAAEGKNKRKK